MVLINLTCIGGLRNSAKQFLLESSTMSKTLCDWSKADIKKDYARLFALISNPAFYCRKCARSAARPEVLCKAAKLRIKDVDPTGEAREINGLDLSE